MPIYFGDGLAGIAWASGYLMRKYNIDIGTNEMFIDWDAKILTANVKWIKDYSLETGLEGLVYYAIARRSNNNSHSLIDDEYIMELVDLLKKGGLASESLIEGLMSTINGDPVDTSGLFERILENVNIKMQNNYKDISHLGLDGGYAGIGLKLLRA